MRPDTATCAHCGKVFPLKTTGRPAKYRKPSCRVMASEKKHRRPKVSFEDRVAARIWQALVDANLVTGELPPMRKAGDPS